MRRLLLLFAGLCFNVSLSAQPSDFIALKKKGKTLRSYYTGSNIEFETANGQYKNALITQIRHDTLYLREYIVRTVMTNMGFYITDTAGSVSHQVYYKDIYRIGKKQSGFNWKASGAALFGGGMLLTLASGVVYLADREKFSPELMGAGAGLGAIGYILLRSTSNSIVIGKKKYTLEYISLSK
ncbi:MAG TPA: hypothetical protein PKK69_02590 [Ferruginibacter sp.]|nr:hypothetical protein [Ferruginibacter sp.]